MSNIQHYVKSIYIYIYRHCAMVVTGIKFSSIVVIRSATEISSL